MIQSYKLEEKDYRGERFAQWDVDLKGIMIIVITQPDIIRLFILHILKWV